MNDLTTDNVYGAIERQLRDCKTPKDVTKPKSFQEVVEENQVKIKGYKTELDTLGSWDNDYNNMALSGIFAIVGGIIFFFGAIACEIILLKIISWMMFITVIFSFAHFHEKLTNKDEKRKELRNKIYNEDIT